MLFGSDTLLNKHFFITAGLTVENGYVGFSSCAGLCLASVVFLLCCCQVLPN